MTVRIGIIGTGFGANVQLPGFRCVDGAEVVAVTSARIERAHAVAAEFGVRYAFDDYLTMLKEVELDLVSITTPPYLHREMVLAALEAGAHILCEKPLAMNAGEGAEMLAAAERLGRIHAVDFEFRFIPARASMKRLLDAGEIGEPFFARIADLTPTRLTLPYGWFFDRARGGGMLQAIGSHYMDVLKWWLSPVESVVADLRAVVAERPDETGAIHRVTADDSAMISARLQSGMVARVDLSGVARGAERRMEVYGSDGTLVIDGSKLYLARDGEPEEIVPDDRDQGRLEDPRLGPFVELAQRVVDRIEGSDSGPITTIADGLEVQRVMDAIWLSSDERREVRVSEV